MLFIVIYSHNKKQQFLDSLIFDFNPNATVIQTILLLKNKGQGKQFLYYRPKINCQTCC